MRGAATMGGALVVAALAACGGVVRVQAAELSNLDSGLPNTLDDAFAVAPGRIELQGAARYDHQNGRDAVRLLPRVQVGIVEGLQANVALPYIAGSGRRENPIDPSAGLLYNLNREREWLPAFALSADFTKPVGDPRRSAEAGVTAIATKTITPAVDRRLHLNVSWLRSLSPDEEERRDRYRVVTGYSQLLSSDVVLVLDYLREQQGRRDARDANVLEAGLRYQFSDRLTLGVGTGVGIGRDSPRFRGIISLQLGFGGH